MKKFISILLIAFIVLGMFLMVKNSKYDFEGQDINGSVTLKTFDGKYKIIYFGYTACPDVCPATLSTLSNVLNEIKNDDIIVIFASLDPQRDTLEALDEYAKYFYPNSYAITVKDLPKVAKNYGVKYQKVKLEKSAMEYSVAHSSSIYLLDKNGKFISEVSNLTAENIKKQIQSMIDKN
ncbi:MAG: SCO family protein [Campylobacter sp.]